MAYSLGMGKMEKSVHVEGQAPQRCSPSLRLGSSHPKAYFSCGGALLLPHPLACSQSKLASGC